MSDISTLWERTCLLSDVQWLVCYFITSWYNRKFSILEPDKIRIQRESIHGIKLSCLRCSDLTTGRLKTDGYLWPLLRPCQQNNLLQKSQVKCSIPHCCWVDHQLSLQVQITLPMNAMRPHKAITGHGHILNQSHVHIILSFRPCHYIRKSLTQNCPIRRDFDVLCMIVRM